MFYIFLTSCVNHKAVHLKNFFKLFDAHGAVCVVSMLETKMLKTDAKNFLKIKHKTFNKKD